MKRILKHYGSRCVIHFRVVFGPATKPLQVVSESRPHTCTYGILFQLSSSPVVTIISIRFLNETSLSWQRSTPLQRHHLHGFKQIESSNTLQYCISALNGIANSMDLMQNPVGPGLARRVRGVQKSVTLLSTAIIPFSRLGSLVRRSLWGGGQWTSYDLQPPDRYHCLCFDVALQHAIICSDHPGHKHPNHT